jgi:hypothetical protein
MPNVVVYLLARDHAALIEEGHDPAYWVRAAVKRALSERESMGDPGVDGSATESARVEPSPSRSESAPSGRFTGSSAADINDLIAREVKPDPKPSKAEKKGRR